MINLLHGFCMALADSVPGVSGGTIAFLMGFYDKFINALNSLFSGTREERLTALKYLIKLGIGWVIGMGLAVTILASVFEKGIYQMSSLFIGFILFAIPVTVMEEAGCLKSLKRAVFILPGMAIVLLIAMLGVGGVADTTSLTPLMVIYIVLAGMSAISAMVLPGISGSTLLLTFGLYIPVINAVKNLFHFNFSGLGLIIALGVGVILGALITVRLLKKALEKFRGQTIYAVIGMMLGSIYAIIQGPTTLEEPQAAMTLESFCILPFIIGALLVIGMKAAQVYHKKNLEA